MNENLNEEGNSYRFYTPGQLVTLKHKELNSPIMLIQEKVTRQFKQGDQMYNIFKGMKCI